MGYYGLGPGNTIPDKLSALQQLLRKLPLESALEALELLEKITRNVVQSPTEEKFRTLKLTNPKLAPMLSILALQDIMREMGWQTDGETMVLPSSVRLDFQEHVVKIIEVKDYYKKEIEKAKKMEKIAADPAKAEVQRQMEIDRREREAAAAAVSGTPTPVSAAPVAAAATPSAQLPVAANQTREPSPPPAPSPVTAVAPPPPVPTAAPEQAQSAQDQMAQLRAQQQQKYEMAPRDQSNVTVGTVEAPTHRRWYQCFGGGPAS